VGADERRHHKSPWLRKYNQDPKHQRKAARASARRRRKVRRYRRKGHRDVHRSVAERVAGRRLSSKELVHHIDENKENNDPANLLIGITATKHQLIHAQLRREGPRPTTMTIFPRRRSTPGLKYKFKTKPFRHQAKALKKMILKRGGFLSMEMGTGKSKVAIDFCCAMHLKAGVQHVVIVCPKSVVPVWRVEIRKHAPTKIRKKIKWVILNYDKLPDIERFVNDETFIYEGKKHVLKKFLAQEKSVLICDESHLLKTPSSRRAVAVYSMRKATDYVLMLTGTPVTKNPLDLYQQFKILNDTILGTNFNHYKKQYCVYGGYGNYQLLRYINLPRLKRTVKPWVFNAKKDDCLDLPSRTDQIVPVKLTGKAQELYEEMSSEGMVELEGEEIDTEIVLTRILRLQQIGSGYLPRADGKGIRRFNNPKLDQFKADLADFQSQEIGKFVTFCQFIPDLKATAQAAKEAGYRVILFHGDVSINDRERRLALFDETDEPTAFISQIDAGSMGISLTAASEAIFFSHTRKYATFAQTKDRLHRIGQHHPVTYRHYIAGVDQAIWIANRMKKDVADLLLTHPELLMQKQIDLKS
jgi:SNF2 family DNA or RNA helicase